MTQEEINDLLERPQPTCASNQDEEDKQMSKRATHPNVMVTIYDGEPDVICECPGELCKFARFYFDPPGPDDECVYCREGRACTSASAVYAAIAATIKMLQDAKAEVES